MTESAPTAAEHEALRARLAALSAASLRSSASLDLETVLTEVVESARTLTGARFGADDYIVKPFSPTELTARIGAVLRWRAAPVPFVLGELAIDYEQRRVTVAGRRVELTATEYELLRVLAQDAGRVLTHETLLRRVWAGRPARAAPAGRADVGLACLRPCVTPGARTWDITDHDPASACSPTAGPAPPGAVGRRGPAAAVARLGGGVAGEPPGPVLRACNRSAASVPRTSPTTM